MEVMGRQKKEGDVDKEVFLSISSFLLNFPLNNFDGPLVRELVSSVSPVPSSNPDQAVPAHESAKRCLFLSDAILESIP